MTRNRLMPVLALLTVLALAACSTSAPSSAGASAGSGASSATGAPSTPASALPVGQRNVVGPDRHGMGTDLGQPAGRLPDLSGSDPRRGDRDGSGIGRPRHHRWRRPDGRDHDAVRAHRSGLHHRRALGAARGRELHPRHDRPARRLQGRAPGDADRRPHEPQDPVRGWLPATADRSLLPRRIAGGASTQRSRTIARLSCS